MAKLAKLHQIWSHCVGMVPTSVSPRHRLLLKPHSDGLYETQCDTDMSNSLHLLHVQKMVYATAFYAVIYAPLNEL